MNITKVSNLFDGSDVDMYNLNIRLAVDSQQAKINVPSSRLDRYEQKTSELIVA